MIKNLLVLITATVLVCSNLPVEAKSDKSSKSSKSQKSGKKGKNGLKQQVAELQAIVAGLQADVAELQGNGEPVDPYVGDYHTTLLENGIFGCGNTTDPGPLFGTPAAISYFQEQAISSGSTRSATTVATADGASLYLPEYTLLTQELRLSGQYEEDIRTEGNFTLAIESDGELTIDAGPDVNVTGQMSEDGSSFTILVNGLFEEDGCDDAFTVMMVGHRIQ